MPHVAYVKSIAVSLPLLFIFPFAAAAEKSDYFVGADYLFSFYNEPGTDAEASRAFRLSGGRKFSEVSVETQLMTGLEDTNFTVAGQRKTIELDYLAIISFRALSQRQRMVSRSAWRNAWPVNIYGRGR